MSNDKIVFKNETDIKDKENKDPWKILIVDDEDEVHNITLLAMSNYSFNGKRLKFLNAYSAKEASQIFREHNDIAVVLLDVIMEEEDSGLKLVKYIRDELKNSFVQIILRTGQPGEVPEQSIIAQYEINDYKEKTELTIQKLYTIVTTSLRSYNLSQKLNKEVINLKIAKEALRTETEQLSVTLRSIGDGVISTDRDGNIRIMNKIAESLTGWKSHDAVGKPLREIFNIINEKTRISCENPVEKVLKTGKIIKLANHTVLISKNGIERVIADSGAPILDSNGKIIGVVLAFRDITEQEKMTEEISRMQNLEALGILAGGIAHDFNNLLTAILGNINLARLYLDENGEVSKFLLEAEKASLSSKNLTMQLLTFAKGGDPIKRVGNIKDLLEESVIFLLRGSKVKAKFNFSDNLWLSIFDPGQMTQVFNNLIINAREAMDKGGYLKINIENFIHKSGDNLPLIKEKYIKITIQDEGVGIPKKYIGKIFDPYFTTKKLGHGLGLALVYSIIMKHEGLIIVSSEEHQGTVFTLYLPASENNDLVINDVKIEISKGKGKILVMDDEFGVREVICYMLKYLGFQVEIVKDGEEAINMFNKYNKNEFPFDCVILDLTVPGGMGGVDTLKQIRKIDPYVKAIVISGYSNDPIMSNYKKYGFNGIVVKPFRVDDLSKILSEII